MKTILVLEDERCWQIILKEKLTERGYDVRVTSNVFTALHTTAWTHVDMAVLDWEVPPYKAHEIEDSLQARGIPCVYITSHEVKDLRGLTENPVFHKCASELSLMLDMIDCILLDVAKEM